MAEVTTLIARARWLMRKSDWFERRAEVNRLQARMLRADVDRRRGIPAVAECTCVVNGVPNALCEFCQGTGEVEP